MKLFFKVVFIILAGLSSITAQTGQGIFRKDTLKILAVMVEFQADKYDATIGTGKFGSHYTKDYSDTIADPLPHNAAYFEDHLLFAENYYRKVSNGKLNIKYQVLPEVITVSKMMRDYSPIYKSKDLSLLGNFGKEAWELVFQKYPNINYGDYDLFIIFHAGVSNFLTTGSYEINRNLPAIYMGENSLKRIYGNDFAGLLNINGSHFIPNSIIMPEAESREITAIDDSKMLLQISINGILVANIASFLGLPDLYNTETGITAIGRFGLMDGQAMVANNGLFPPEPSAWEKIYLGWAVPSVTGIKNIKAGIAAQRSASPADTTILKIPINDYEYFLVENRQQDVGKDGIKMTYKKGNETFTNLLQPDTTGLFTFDEKEIKGGVVVDVDEFDAAMPGNGIVIWHIDEKIINEKISANEINNDRLKRGVSVVEADGILDIGETVKSLLGDYYSDGTIDDFWYSGNSAKYYKNKFSDDSKPSSKSNNGSNSFITMQNFSTVSSKMTFDLSFGGTVINKTAAKLNLSQTPSSLITLKEAGGNYTYLLSGYDLRKYDAAGNLVKTIAGFSQFRPVSFTINDTLFFAGANGQSLKLWNTVNDRVIGFTMFSKISAPLVFHTTPNGTNEILIPIRTGVVATLNLGLDYYNGDTALGLLTSFNAGKEIIQINAFEDYVSVITEAGFYDSIGNNVTIPYKIISSALTKNAAGGFINVVLSEGNRFYIIVNGVITSEFRISETSEITKFILADITNNGENSIVFSAGGRLYAVNQKGSVHDNFPLTLPTGNTFTPDILSFNYDSDKSADLVTYTTSGDVYFINGKTGRIIKELSLTTGSKVISGNMHAIDNSLQVPVYDNLGLTVLTENNTLYTWDLLIASTKKLWYSSLCDYTNSSYIPQSASDLVFEQLLPEGKIYNWPNPVYGSETNIRFVVNEESRINIKVFDMGGQIAAEFQKDVYANIDNEVVWNVKDIKSGVYFARVEAISKTGKSANKIVKIVVIK